MTASLGKPSIELIGACVHKQSILHGQPSKLRHFIDAEPLHCWVELLHDERLCFMHEQRYMDEQPYFAHDLHRACKNK